MAKYLRCADSSGLSRDRFDYKVLVETETAIMWIVSQPAGAGGPRRHYHHSDQLFYLLRGRLEIELGGRKWIAEPESLIFIPAGVPHSHVALEDELHLDVIAPASGRGSPISIQADAGGTADRGVTPAAAAPPDVPSRSAQGWVRKTDTVEFANTHVPGFRVRRMIDRAQGSSAVALYVAEVEPGPGPSWHIHEFDQFYYVLDGTLAVDIANRHYDVTPHQLLVIPAGVPHRNWNASSEPERHLAMLIPEPESRERPWDIPVDFAVS